MITTNIHDIAHGHLLVHAESPIGPWSSPVYVEGAIGIDPDLSWDDQGHCHLTWSDVLRGGISQAIIDTDSGRMLSEPVSLWRGTGGAHPEGPHLIRRNDWWYLLIAEGGTGRGHMVTVARSRDIDGPFEAAPHNPILTHRSLESSIESTGHSDLVELVDGTWALVFLATRPRGSFPRWHTNGRETFLAGVDWVDDWPVVDEDRFPVSPVDTSFTDDFTASELHPRWISPGNEPRSFAFTSSGGLRLQRGRSVDDQEASRLLAVRARDQTWAAEIDVEGEVSLTVRMDDAHQAMVERVGDELRARIVIGPLDQLIARVAAPAGGARLQIRATEFEAARGARRGPDVIRLGYGTGDHNFVELATLDGRYLSTEVAGGFTGRVIGVEALSDEVTLRSFHYRADV